MTLLDAKGRTNERGAVMVTAMLVLLVLTAIAVVAIRATYTEIASSGNYRLARQGLAVTESGSLATLSAASENAVDFMKAAKGCKVDMSQLAQGVFDSTKFGSFGADTWVVSGVKPANFETTMVLEPGEMPAPGSSGDRYCMKIYSWYTTGWLGGSLEDVGGTMTETRMGSKRILARVMVGPTDCSDGGNQWSTSQCAQ